MKKLIVLSGGIGTRTKLDYPKQYHEVNGKKIVNHLIENVESFFDQITVVADPKYWNDIFTNSKVNFVKNGNTRLDSLKNGLVASNPSDEDIIFIHEAARPGLTEEDINKHLESTRLGQGTISCVPSINTMFMIDKDSNIQRVVRKEQIVSGYNPQSFAGNDINLVVSKLDNYKNDEDLSEIMINEGISIKTVSCVGDLRKITNPQDIKWAEEFLK